MAGARPVRRDGYLSRTPRFPAAGFRQSGVTPHLGSCATHFEGGQDAGEQRAHGGDDAMSGAAGLVIVTS